MGVGSALSWAELTALGRAGAKVRRGSKTGVTKCGTVMGWEQGGGMQHWATEGGTVNEWGQGGSTVPGSSTKHGAQGRLPCTFCSCSKEERRGGEFRPRHRGSLKSAREGKGGRGVTWAGEAEGGGRYTALVWCRLVSLAKEPWVSFGAWVVGRRGRSSVYFSPRGGGDHWVRDRERDECAPRRGVSRSAPLPSPIGGAHVPAQTAGARYEAARPAGWRWSKPRGFSVALPCRLQHARPPKLTKGLYLAGP